MLPRIQPAKAGTTRSDATVVVVVDGGTGPVNHTTNVSYLLVYKEPAATQSDPPTPVPPTQSRQSLPCRVRARLRRSADHQHARRVGILNHRQPTAVPLGRLAQQVTLTSVRRCVLQPITVIPFVAAPNRRALARVPGKVWTQTSNRRIAATEHCTG